MHLVFLNQYYPPDAAPTGVMLAAVAEELAAQGHQVTVICAEGGYAETRPNTARHKPQEEEGAQSDGHGPPLKGGIRVLRIRATRFGRGTFLGKIADYFSYYLGVAWRLMWMRPGRIVALTTPPYLSVLARIFSKLRGGDHAHWVMDLYPDVMVAHGMLKDGGAPHRLLAGLARWGFGGKRCAALLTLGPDMAERIGRLMGKGSEAAVWVPLWSAEGDGGLAVDGMALAKRRQEMGWRDGELVVMYSGNMGLGHRFAEILEVIGKGQESEGPDPRSTVRFVFFGGGKRRGEIEAFVAAHPELPVELHDYAPAELLDVHLRSADVHLASLDASWTGTMLPSKLQGIFAAARPVIFIGGADSGIGRWVLESGGGWVVAPGDVQGLRAALDEARDPLQRETRGRAAREFAERNFNRVVNARRVTQILAA